MRGTLGMRKSQQREAAIDYQKIVLQAWQDVDNTARERFQQGSTDFLNVLTGRNALLQSQSSLSQIETDLMALYRALGGGWKQIVGAPKSRCRPSSRRTSRCGTANVTSIEAAAGAMVSSTNSAR